MDKVEKIKNYAAKWFDRGREYGKVPITKSMLIELEKEGEELLLELGYSQPKEKPPLLSDEEIGNVFKGKVVFASSPEMRREAEASLVAQAQREVDVKFYERS